MSGATQAAREPLTEATAEAVAAISKAARHEKRVRRLMPDGEVFEGTARGLVVDQERRYSPRREHDLRDCHLWVSSITEHFWPLAELIPQIGTGELKFD